MSVEFDEGVRQFFARLHDSLAVTIETSQIWSLDSQGFHIIYHQGEKKAHLEALARQACIKNQLLFDYSVCVYPFKVNARQSGALLVDCDRVWDDAAKQPISDLLDGHFESLKQLLMAERYARLSGSAKRADWLGKAISLAYELEYANDTKPIYEQMHDALKNMMYARNFFVARRHPSGDVLTFEYLCDEFDKDSGPIPVSEGVLQGSLSAYVVKSGRVIRGPSNQLAKEMGYGGESSYGEEAYDWLGVPLALGQQVYGVIVVQSYTPGIRFNDHDPNLLAVLAEALAISFHRRQIREQLEQLVEQRTKQLANTVKSLEASVEAQKQLQKELVEAEKQAALGRLVTGVAHELNTPLGVCITANSVVSDLLSESVDKFNANNLKKADLERLFTGLKSSNALLTTNLDRSCVLIERFKQISAQPHQMNQCRFDVGELLSVIAEHFLSLPEHAEYQFKLNLEGSLEADSYPAAVLQVLEQLIENSVVHGFANKPEGTIEVSARCYANKIWLDYEDDGAGLQSDAKTKAFDPFFTTKRNEGRVGIGLHIVANLVSQTLKGSTSLGENRDGGFKLQICFPVTIGSEG